MHQHGAWGRRNEDRAGWPVVGIGLIAFTYLAAITWLFETLLPLPQAARIALSVLLTAPLALLIGTMVMVLPGVNSNSYGAPDR